MKLLQTKHLSKVYALVLVILSLGVCAIAFRMNLFRYNNFDFGKFDLGNMVQMIWYTMHGKLMYLTDYFGANVPRWSMSHVDPILLLFVPIFALIPHPLTLVFAQIILVTLVSCLLVYKIAILNLKSESAAFMVGVSYLLYPALGYLNTITGYHGVSAAIPFFLGAFYVLEKMHHEQKYTNRRLLLFWVLAIITMSGKEQIPVYTGLLALFMLTARAPMPQGIKFGTASWFGIWLKSKIAKNALALGIVSLVWFVTAFFVIIPRNAHYRIESYTNFAQELKIDSDLSNDVLRDNYFLARYGDFGDSFTEVVLGMLLRPKELVRVMFSGDRADNFEKTFLPVSFLPFAAPQILFIAVPDLVINYATTAGGIGTSEITNHRISMIIPVLFISLIFGLKTISEYLSTALAKISRKKIHAKKISTVAGFLLVLISFKTTIQYNNPIFLWATQALEKRLSIKVLAKSNTDIAYKNDIAIGDRFRLSGIENKDRECARKAVKVIPEKASVSGPDYLGAHLAQRETYAIFPSLYTKADYVIVDVFSQKIMRILESDVTFVREVVGDMIADPHYQNVMSCGNLFVFKRVEAQSTTDILPLQERFKYESAKKEMEIFQNLYLTDYAFPETMHRGKPENVKFVYQKKAEGLDDYVIFTSLVNEEDGEIYQVANLPAYGVVQLKDWVTNRYYVEENILSLPAELKPGVYKSFIGISNNIRTRSIYLGNVRVE